MNIDYGLPYVQKFALKKVVKSPVSARHTEFTVISSMDDDISHPNQDLMKLSLEAISSANRADMSPLFNRARGGWWELNVWPGEHYKILAGIASILKPKVVIDIGTLLGGSAIILKHFAPQAFVATFDIVPWYRFEKTLLSKADFNDGFVQFIDDLSDYSQIVKHKAILESADLFFIDAAKDGLMEYKLLENFSKISLKKGAILVWDDIRLWNMLKLWRQIHYPKLDLTSFGHWTGTGIVQIR